LNPSLSPSPFHAEFVKKTVVGSGTLYSLPPLLLLYIFATIFPAACRPILLLLSPQFAYLHCAAKMPSGVKCGGEKQKSFVKEEEGRKNGPIEKESVKCELYLSQQQQV
jgi:hypothetical protein